MKKKLLFIVLITHFVFLIFQLYANETKGKYYDIVCGVWADGFPVGSGHNGIYVFNKDYSFIHKLYDQSINRFAVTNGQWKLENAKLYLKTKKDEEWKLSSDVRSFNKYWYPEGIEKGYPHSISIRFYKNKELTFYIDSYFKLNKCGSTEP